MGNIDDISLNVIDGDVKNIEHDISNLRADILQMLCLEKLYREENDNEKRPNLLIDGKEVTSHYKMNSFQGKIWY